MLDILVFLFFFFKQKTADEMRISDWSSDVCSSDLERCPSQGRDRPCDRPGSSTPYRYRGRPLRCSAAGPCRACSCRSYPFRPSDRQSPFALACHGPWPNVPYRPCRRRLGPFLPIRGSCPCPPPPAVAARDRTSGVGG